MTRRKFYTFACLFVLFAAPVAAAEKTTDAEQQKLIEVLRSDAPPAKKADACKRLAMIGTSDAAPALAPLLEDPKLSSWAPVALEAIPGEPCNEVLRDSTGKLHGRLLVAAINSLGVRHDVKATDMLVSRLKDSDADVAAAAAVALGHIGTEGAVAALRPAIQEGPKEVRSAAAEGVILCAERALQSGKYSEATALYDEVRAADLPEQRVIEATRGAILARGTAGIPLLIEQLRSQDKHFFALGLTVARELPGREVTEAIAAQIDNAAPQRQALLLMALADRNEPSVAPLIVKAAREGSDAVRQQALRALAKVDENLAAPVLLDAVLEANGKQPASAALSETAMNVIDGLHGDAIDRLVADRLPGEHGRGLVLLIELAGRRHIASATPALWKAADGDDAAIRAAALSALGGTIAFDDLSRLAARAAAAKTDEEAAPIAQAVENAAHRMTDREACIEKIVQAMSRSHAPESVQCKLLEVLGEIEGAKALAVVADAARSSDELRRDTAYRLLGQWMSVDAAPVLVDLVEHAQSEKYKVRAVRAYIRLARQFVMPAAERAEMCRTALKIAERPDDKRLVLEILLRYPSPEMLQLALEAAKTPELKDEAAMVALSISSAHGGDSKELRKALAQAGHKTVKLEILKATYGEGEQSRDVTKTLRKYTRNYRVIFLPDAKYNDSFGGDPAPGVVKHLTVRYRINGAEGETTLNENATILLPVPR